MQSLIVKNDLIFDIGMHKGKDTDFYLKKGFKVIAVEANPALVETARFKFMDEIKTGQLVIIDKAINNESGSLRFYINEAKDDWGSIVPGWNSTGNETVREIEVQAVLLEEIVKEFGMPYYMKIDIEGADIICLKSLYKLGSKPQFISCELLSPHNFNTRDIDCLDILAHLKVLGYNRFYPSNQKLNETLKCSDPSKEGIYVDYQFDGESSGLFGKDISGEWLLYDYFVYQYLSYFHEYDGTSMMDYAKRLLNKYLGTAFRESALFPRYDWFDVHATTM